jgi:hypothetical protein
LTISHSPTSPGAELECDGAFANHKQAYFGDLHVHTRDSFDAYFFNSINGPREAYRFAKGEPSGLPSGNTNPEIPARTVQLDRPLDFAAVTDHAEFLGNFGTLCELGGVLPPGANPACAILGQNTRDNITALVNGETPITTQLLFTGLVPLPLTRFAWAEQKRITDEENVPCEFTTLHGYEYSSQKTGQMLHRNVIFLGDRLPDDVFGSALVTDILIDDNVNDEWRLFDNLVQTCVDVDGCQVLTIPHNPNLSDGRMFLPTDPGTGVPVARDGAPLTEADARLRASMDRAIELTQHKGSSECAVGLEGSYLQGEESSCNFELFKNVCRGKDTDPPSCKRACTGDPLTDPAFCGLNQEPTYRVDLCQTLGPDGGSGPTDNCMTPLDSVRNALAEGLAVKQALNGVNPYRQALIASTDTHNGVPGNVQEKDFAGHGGVLDDEPRDQLGYWICDGSNENPSDPANCSNRHFLDRGRGFNPGGLAGVWAEQNTRAAIWNGVHRGETFGTSGPRIRIRTLATWQTPPADICERLSAGDNPIDLGEISGARMGEDLPARTGEAPYIVAWAMQDPGGAEPGNPLQRIDIVKGWVDGANAPKVRVFAGVARTTDTVLPPSREDCSVQVGQHPEQLCAVWHDPDFDPARDAYWYARVLEIPSCRWSAHLCLSNHVNCELLDPANSEFTETSGMRGFEGCCAIEGAPGSFSGRNTFHAIEERAWASPIWYDPSRNSTTGP